LSHHGAPCSSTGGQHVAGVTVPSAAGAASRHTRTIRAVTARRTTRPARTVDDGRMYVARGITLPPSVPSPCGSTGPRSPPALRFGLGGLAQPPGLLPARPSACVRLRQPGARLGSAVRPAPPARLGAATRSRFLPRLIAPRTARCCQSKEPDAGVHAPPPDVRTPPACTCPVVSALFPPSRARREARRAISAAFSVRAFSTGVVVGAGCGTSPPDRPSPPTSVSSPRPSPPYRRARGSRADMSARTVEVYARSVVGGGSLLFVGRCGFWN